ncbi:hypothetical protein [Marichromatium bheemlicum]|uniref:Uncharacterized protein n=1 Tax=Marichromatium bheemlicum TaxID=365339 RepID=A0ABX1I774_9GAMM|nr:hypothetical protein [Marichromatium bheemlicum]NKN32894.1 hypothetical protein [Marichromatium bheemlicum]
MNEPTAAGSPAAVFSCVGVKSPLWKRGLGDLIQTNRAMPRDEYADHRRIIDGGCVGLPVHGRCRVVDEMAERVTQPTSAVGWVAVVWQPNDAMSLDE